MPLLGLIVSETQKDSLWWDPHPFKDSPPGGWRPVDPDGPDDTSCFQPVQDGNGDWFIVKADVDNVDPNDTTLAWMREMAYDTESPNYVGFTEYVEPEN